MYSSKVKIFEENLNEDTLDVQIKIDNIKQRAKEQGFVKKGDMLVNLAAMPVANKGMVNTLRISEIE